MMKTLSDAVFRLESLAACSGIPYTKELREVAAFLSDEDGLKAMDQTLSYLTRHDLNYAATPLTAARMAVIECRRRRLAAADAEEPELSRLRVRVRGLERELRDLRAAIEDL